MGPAKCEVGSLSDTPCVHVAVGIALAWGGHFGAPDIHVCDAHAAEAESDGATVEPLDCPCCGGSGRIASSGEGLYVFLAATAARIKGFERAIGKLNERRTQYVSERNENDYRVTLCDQEIAAYHRCADYHEAATEHARVAAAICIRCHGTGGAAVVKTCGCGRHYDAPAWGALHVRGPMDDGDGGELELRDCDCGSTIAIRVPTTPSMRRVA